MRQDDLDAVTGIEIETLSPWSPGSLAEELLVRQGRQLVAESTDLGIVGWCCCRWIWPEAELLKIAVATEHRKKGIGTSLFSSLVTELQFQAFTALFLEVRAKNRQALSFYQGHRFQQVGTRLNYFSHPADDALILKRDLRLD